MNYVPILDLSIRHTYYQDERCPDFAMAPNAETEALARNHRLIFRYRPDGLSIAGPVDEAGTAFIPLTPGAVFGWKLVLRNASFPLFTELASLDDRSAPLFRSGPTTAPLTVLELTDGPPASSPIGSVFAAVEISYDARPTTGGSHYRRYQIDFAPSEAHWSYYCLTDLAATAGALAILDSATSEPLAFGPENTRDLVAKPDIEDSVATSLANQYPSLRRLRFVSDQPVVNRQGARRGLELRLDGRRLLGPLANPGLAAPIPVEVVTGGTSAPAPALSRIVMYAKQSSASSGG